MKSRAEGSPSKQSPKEDSGVRPRPASPTPKPYLGTAAYESEIDTSIAKLKYEGVGGNVDARHLETTASSVEDALLGVTIMKGKLGVHQKQLRELRELIERPMGDDLEQAAEHLSRVAKVEDDVLSLLSVVSEELDKQQALFDASHGETLEQLRKAYQGLQKRRQELRERHDGLRGSASKEDFEASQAEIDRVSGLVQRLQNFPEVIRRIG